MDAIPSSADAELAVLADVVWTQRTAMEQLAFRLVALELVLAADLRRYVGRCVDEVAAASDRLERIEDRRLVAVGALAAACGRPADSLRLADLVAAAPEPWATVLADHHDHLRALAVEIDHATAENTRLCGATLDELADELTAAGVAGPRVPGDPGGVRRPLRLVSVAADVGSGT